MHRRVLLPLMAGLLGLVAVAPAVVSGPSALAVGPEAFKATTTTDPDSAPDGDAYGDTDTDTDGDAYGDADGDGDADTDADGDTDGDTASGSGPDGDSGTAPGRDGGSATPGTTGPRSGPGSGSGPARSTSECDEPLTDRGPAPQVGEAAETYEAGNAGTVEVERLSEGELRIVGASPDDGWTEEIRKESGPRVSVRFTRQGRSPSLIRFAASMDQKGTEIHIRVTECG